MAFIKFQEREEDRTYIDFTFYLDEKTPVASLATKRWEKDRHRRIYNVEVMEEHQRKGIATAFLRAVMDMHRKEGVTTFSGHVDKNNEAAIALYSKLNFQFHRAPTNENKWKIIWE